MDDGELALLVDLHRKNQRQGPGSAESAQMALDISGLSNRTGAVIADIGCGTGAASIFLAKRIGARVTAVDFLQPFLDELEQRCREMGVDGRIQCLCASMDALPFEEESLDAIWSEGAIYNIGFQRGLTLWRPFLKENGVIVVSEITWLSQQRPKAIEDYWNTHYGDMGTAEEKMAVLAASGYDVVGYFTLPRSCWLDNYYEPLANQHQHFLERHEYSAAAEAIVNAEKAERKMYEDYSDFVSYGVYIARRSSDDIA